MSARIKCILFDMDGVLLDSLDAHLNFVRNFAIEKNLDLKIPDSKKFKNDILGKGVTISPMFEFFRALGFSKEDAESGDDLYKEEFHKTSLTIFDEIDFLLKLLHEEGIKLGIATANIRNVVNVALHEQLDFFDPELIFTHDDARVDTKAEALDKSSELLNISPDQILFVGDQSSDFEASQNAKTNFLGVTYGWGFVDRNHKALFATDVVELKDTLLEIIRNGSEPCQSRFEIIKMKLDNAHSLFVYHAGQRNTSIRYYFIAMSLTGAGISAIFSDGLAVPSKTIIALFLGLLGTALSLSFWGLDNRNQALVEDDEKQIEVAQNELDILNIKSEFGAERNCDTAPWVCVLSYGQIMPFVFSFFTLAGLLVIAVAWFLGTEHFSTLIATPAELERPFYSVLALAVSTILVIVIHVWRHEKQRLWQAIKDARR